MRIFPVSMAWAVLSATAVASMPASAKTSAFVPRPRPPLADAPTTRVFVERTHVEGDLPAPDRAVVDAALRRGLASPESTVLPDAEQCTTRACRNDLAHDRESAHRVELRLLAGSRTYDIELRAYRPGASEPYATTTGRCDICGLAELEHLVLARADALRQRLAPDQTAARSNTTTTAPATPRDVETKPARRILGGAAIGIGLAAFAGGIALLAIDGREIAARCRDTDQRDLDGDCRWVHRTMAGGIAMAVTGVALTSTGATLLIIDRRHRDPRYAVSTTVSPQRLSLAISF